MEELAMLLQKSAECHQSSWNGTSYDLDIDQAVVKTCGNSPWIRLVGILLFTAWNDSLEWAEEKLNAENGRSR